MKTFMEKKDQAFIISSDKTNAFFTRKNKSNVCSAINRIEKKLELIEKKKQNNIKILQG